MSKVYANGIQQIVGNKTSDAEKQIQLYEKTWRELRSKLDSLLIATNVLKGDVIRKMCQTLDSLDYDGRIKHIRDNWGSLYADRAMPLLNQLQTLEKQIGSVKTDKDVS